MLELLYQDTKNVLEEIMITGIIGVGALILGLILGGNGGLGCKATLQTVKSDKKDMHGIIKTGHYRHPPFDFRFHVEPVTNAIISGFGKLSNVERNNVKIKNLKDAIMTKNFTGIRSEFNNILETVKLSGSPQSKLEATAILNKIAEFRLRPHPPFGHPPRSLHSGPSGHVMPLPSHGWSSHTSHSEIPPYDPYWSKPETSNKIKNILTQQLVIS